MQSPTPLKGSPKEEIFTPNENKVCSLEGSPEKVCSI
jgi:hypothetical protein